MTLTQWNVGNALESVGQTTRIDWHVWIKWWSECPDRAAFLAALNSESRLASSGYSSTSAATDAASGSQSDASDDSGVHLTGDERWRNRDGKTITVLTGDERLRDARAFRGTFVAEAERLADDWNLSKQERSKVVGFAAGLAPRLRAALTETERER